MPTESRPTKTMTATPEPIAETVEYDRVVIRLAGDSGDGMQLAGARFTDASATFGNDLATFPNFPAEIRAPAGTLAGVSTFQVQIADYDIVTAGDAPDCLVAMNPAGLLANLKDLRLGGTLILNTDAFTERNLAKAGYQSNPLTDGSLETYRVINAPMETLTKEAVADSGVTGRDVLRSKNFFALGLLSWLFTRPLEPNIEWVERKFGKNPEVAAANIAALQAGYTFGLVTEASPTYRVNPARLPAGTYANVTGNTALAWGLIAASEASGLPLFYGTYPITPASDILHELSRHKDFGVKTFQAEDEIAAIGATIGAAFGGALAATGSSGPGLALKSESMSLALMIELPLLVVDVQRGGPSTGLPTKVEQSDLLFTMFGRHGEAPLPIVAISSPSDAFGCVLEAARIALTYMTPVVILSDNAIANGSEPWKLPDLDQLPDLAPQFATEPNGPDGTFLPYSRDPETFARTWALPGTPGLEHRIGGLEKDSLTGMVSYDAVNHQRMTDTRAWKVKAIADSFPPLVLEGDIDAEILVLGWGSTAGAIVGAARRVRKLGHKVATLQLRHLNPFNPGLGEVLARYPKILIPELNTGQLRHLIRAEFLIEPEGINKVEGQPFTVAELQTKLLEMLG